MPLAILTKRSINEGSIPTSWKHAIVTPVHKSGSKSDTSNYRPISVLPVFAKIQEKAVHEMVYSFLLKNTSSYLLINPVSIHYTLLQPVQLISPTLFCTILTKENLQAWHFWIYLRRLTPSTMNYYL